jgi:hypothetical protein
VHQLINCLILFAAGGGSTSHVDSAIEQENNITINKQDR